MLCCGTLFGTKLKSIVYLMAIDVMFMDIMSMNITAMEKTLCEYIQRYDCLFKTSNDGINLYPTLVSWQFSPNGILLSHRLPCDWVDNSNLWNFFFYSWMITWTYCGAIKSGASGHESMQVTTPELPCLGNLWYFVLWDFAWHFKFYHWLLVILAQIVETQL